MRKIVLVILVTVIQNVGIYAQSKGVFGSGIGNSFLDWTYEQNWGGNAYRWAGYLGFNAYRNNDDPKDHYYGVNPYTAKVVLEGSNYGFRWLYDMVGGSQNKNQTQLNELMRLTGKGFLGIGTDAPISSLDVNGTVGVSNGRNFRVVYGAGGHLKDTELSGLVHLPSLSGGNGWTALYAKQGSASKAGVFEGDVLVYGNVKAKEIKVTINEFPDFVFEKDYNLRSLSEVETFIQENQHLPDIPSEEKVKANGISVGEMNAKLLQKIEELTLYMIEVKKIIDKQQREIENLKANQK
jgi:hypothetical protein